MLEKRQHIFLSYFTTLSAALLNRPGPTTVKLLHPIFTNALSHLRMDISWNTLQCHHYLLILTSVHYYHGYLCPIFDDHFFYFHNLSVKLSGDNVRRN